MIHKEEEKKLALSLRKQGFSYAEILKRVPVAKSTLSLWLRSVGLSKQQKQRLTEKKLFSIKRGWAKWRQQRIDLTEKVKKAARADVKKISERELWLIGVALYWAEGTKQKEHSGAQGVSFNNSDPAMIQVFLRWLRDVIKIQDSEMVFEVYVHENHKNNTKKFLDYWAHIAGIEVKRLRIYFKKNKIRTNRKNIGDNYRGLLRVSVRKSSILNRKISGWSEGITDDIAGSSNGRTVPFEGIYRGPNPCPATRE